MMNYVVIVLTALAVAALFWTSDVWLLSLMLRGKIDSLTYLNPVRGFMVILLSWVPGMLVLALMNGWPKAGDMTAFWGMPAFIFWGFTLKKPVGAWRQHILKTIKLTPEQQQELATRSAFANYLASGGLN